MGEGQEWSWVVSIALVAVPAVIAVIGTAINKEARTPRPIRNIGHMMEALSKAPDGAAKNAMDDLLATYVVAVTAELTETRKLNKYNVAMSVIMVILTGGVVFLLTLWVAGTQGTAWNGVAWTVTILAAFGALVLNIAAISTVYNPSNEKQKKVTAGA